MSIPILLLKYEAGVQAIERLQRWAAYARAERCAQELGKPLLVVGVPKTPFSHGFMERGCGDVCIDLAPRVVRVAEGHWLGAHGQVADVRTIPYPDGYFGAAFASHILEHLSTVADCNVALDELDRVADNVFVVSPHKWSIAAWLHPDHHLWVSKNQGTLLIEQRGR